MNVPNQLTILRILLIPVCLLLWALELPVWAAAVFALAAATDFFDGYLARKHNIVTVFGKFADPVADKILVLTAMIFLTADNRIPAWAVCVVAARELMVDGLRLVAVGKGNVIAAGWLGKIKTTLQYCCVLSGMLLYQGHWLTVTFTFLMAVMTVWSGVQYFWASREVFREAGVKAHRIRQEGKSGKKHVFLWVFAALLCLILPGFYNGLKVAEYHVDAGVSAPIRIAFVSDLHSCRYGEGMGELIDEIDRQSPDLILLGGDIFDDDLPDGNTLAFLQGVAGRYPCYYVTGNHEYWAGADGFASKMAALEALGVTRLSGQMAAVEINGVRLNICGVDDPYAWTEAFDASANAWPGFRDQLQAVSELSREGGYTILLTHRPELFDLYCSYGYDLVLAGHAHGGQWRVPGLLNGLYAPNQGWFPDYAGGLYERDNTVMIVSRGLARESTRVPRFYNRPELLIIELSSGENEI